MTALLLFSACLLFTSLLSDLAGRSILSISVIFLLAGFFGAQFGIIHFEPKQAFLSEFVDVTLVTALFTDASRTGIRDLVRAWRLPGRALLLGLPLTLLGTAALARWLLQLDWNAALLVGAVLSPTDPVFAATLVRGKGIPQRLHHMLNVESGINDGLALPIVLILLSTMSMRKTEPWLIFAELGLGILIGILVPWGAIVFERSKYFATTHRYVPLMGFAVMLLVFSLCRLLGANEFLGAFSAGVTVESFESPVKEGFFRFAQGFGEVLKLGGLMVLGGFVSINAFKELTWREGAFIFLAIAVVRPMAIGVALFRSSLPRRQKWVAGWFGPKGFASVMFSLLVLSSEISSRQRIFQTVALVVAGSIVLLSTTDVLAQRWLSKE